MRRGRGYVNQHCTRRGKEVGQKEECLVSENKEALGDRKIGTLRRRREDGGVFVRVNDCVNGDHESK